MYNAILITGANRGIGFALTKAFVSRNSYVIASYRNKTNAAELLEFQSQHKTQLFAMECDVSQDESVEALHKEVSAKFRSLDMLINNAGILPRGETNIEKMDAIDFLTTININTLGAFRMSKAFLPMIRAGKQKKIIHLSSVMGSLTRNDYGRSYSYRVSKCALNMLSRNLAVELKSEKILSVVLHPGWVRTEMGGQAADLPIEKSVNSIVKFITECTLEKHSGGFFDYHGHELPW